MNTFANRVNVFIRADGNAQIGYGHLMRAMAFATHATALTDVVLIIRNPDVYAFEACEKYSLEYIDVSDVAIENEADYIAELIRSRSILFVDGYQFDEDYLRRVSSKGAYQFAWMTTTIDFFLRAVLSILQNLKILKILNEVLEPNSFMD